MFPAPLETDSLVLRRLAPGEVDLFELYELFAAGREGTAAVFEYVPMEPYDTPKDAHDWLTDAAAEWDDAEAAKYAVYEDGERLAGTAALTPQWERDTADLAVLLGRSFWGNGYAGECARALAEVAFERLDLGLVALGYDAGNDRSRAAIERFVDAHGGQHDGVLRNWTVRDGEPVDAHRYTVSREAYRAATDGT